MRARPALLILILLAAAFCGACDRATVAPEGATPPAGLTQPAPERATDIAASPTATMVVVPLATSSSTPTPSRTWSPVPSHTPSRTPIATLTATDTPSPTPAGRLVSEIGSLDLSLPGCSLREPRSLALDESRGLLYVAGYSSEEEGATYVVGAIDLETRGMLWIAPIPGYPGQAMAVGRDGSVYLACSDAKYARHLLRVSPQSRVVEADVLVDDGSLDSAMAASSDGRWLYVCTASALEVRDARTLELARTVPHDAWASYSHIALDPRRELVLLTVGPRVAAYGSHPGEALWAVELEGNAEDMTYSAEDGIIYLRVDRSGEGGATLVALGVEGGRELGRWTAPNEASYWRFVGAERGVVYVVSVSRGSTRIEALDVLGGAGTLAAFERSLSYDILGVFSPSRRSIYLLDSANHGVSVVQVQGEPVHGLVAQPDLVTAVDVRAVVPDGRGLVYVNDSAGRLSIVDVEAGRLLAQIGAGSGDQMVMDRPGGRLYVPVRGPAEGISVVELDGPTLMGHLQGGDHLTIDAAGGRLFVGSSAQLWEPAQGAVQIYDAQSLERVGEIGRSGIPAYNPVRDEVYITSQSVYIYDGASYESLGELTPDIGAQQILGCNGCKSARGVQVLPELGLVMADVTILSAGKGAGSYPPPRFYDIASLAPLTYPVTTRSLCGTPSPLGSVALADGTEALISTASYARYVFYQNLVMQEPGTGRVLSWRDGVNAHLVLPDERVIYALRVEGDMLAMDLDSGEPLGTTKAHCIKAIDPSSGLLYATEGSKLLILSPSGGEALPPPEAEPAPALAEIRDIAVSPTFGQDRTILMDTAGGLVRSVDGGQSWELVGGLEPSFRSASARRVVAYSPSYATDGTIFVGGHRADSLGLGIWRSDDWGETWRPVWSGLDHLRITRLAVSPQFAGDGQVAAYATFVRLVPTMESGESVFLSQDGGRSWSQVATKPWGDYDTVLPEPEVLFGHEPKALQLAVREYGLEIGRSEDGGVTWQSVLPRVGTELFAGLVSAPDGAAHYALTGLGLYRSLDDGDSWELALDQRIQGRESYVDQWRALALLPGGESHELLLGDGAGGLTRIEPSTLFWGPIPEPTPTPSPTPTYAPIATPTCEVAPDPVFAEAAMAWRDAVGCPVEPATTSSAVGQVFQNGTMIWREFDRRIFAWLDSGYWIEVDDTWREGDPDRDADIVAPEGLLQPVRGFGKVWREVLRGPDTAIGWALSPERSYEARWQRFEGGMLVTDAEGSIVLLATGMRAQP